VKTFHLIGLIYQFPENSAYFD